MKKRELKKELKKAAGKNLIIKLISEQDGTLIGLSEGSKIEKNNFHLTKRRGVYYDLPIRKIQSIQVWEMFEAQNFLEDLHRFFRRDFGLTWEIWRKSDRDATAGFINSFKLT